MEEPKVPFNVRHLEGGEGEVASAYHGVPLTTLRLPKRKAVAEQIETDSSHTAIDRIHQQRVGHIFVANRAGT